MANATKRPSVTRRVLSMLAAAVTGVAIGIGIFGIGYSELPSYFGTDPQTCANCHIMQDHYDAWLRGPHANVATCSDCHVPHSNLAAKYWVKLEDGILHGYKFTMESYPVTSTIVIRESSRATVNGACLSCHDMMTADIRYIVGVDGGTLDCTRCHANTGHMK